MRLDELACLAKFVDLGRLLVLLALHNGVDLFALALLLLEHRILFLHLVELRNGLITLVLSPAVLVGLILQFRVVLFNVGTVTVSGALVLLPQLLLILFIGFLKRFVLSLDVSVVLRKTSKGI